MNERKPGADLSVFATCPQSADHDRASYAARVADVARWSERNGCEGILVYTDNRLCDPWLVSQMIIECTDRLAPLVAVQPIYMHPYSVAKMIATFAHVYGRRIVLNLVAGGFKNDLDALGDPTPHDRRYQRLVEYMQIVQRLCAGDAPVTMAGEFYRVSDLRLAPALPEGTQPGVFVSGSSEAGLAAARELGATAVVYPKPPGEERGAAEYAPSPAGVRVGIVARPTTEEAWRVARARFPEDRKGQITHAMAMKVSDSVWHRQLSRLANHAEASPYWLVPFQNYKTFCPYLVGSYADVSAEVERYVTLGYRTFILDIPPEEEELHHAGIVFRNARRVAR